jgi:nucleoid-associated protein YgaU
MLVEGGSWRRRRKAGGWLPVRLPACGIGLLLAEGALLGQLGPPANHLQALGHLGDASADPVAGVLAAMAFLAEVLVAYLLGIVAIRWLSAVPGSIGRLAGRVTFLVTPAVVRRTLDLLVGGTLLAQATLAAGPAAPPGHRSTLGDPALAVTSTATGSSTLPAVMVGDAGIAATTTDAGWPPAPAAGPGGAHHARAVPGNEQVKTRPTPRRATAPLPPWLGGGPSNPIPVPRENRRPADNDRHAADGRPGQARPGGRDGDGEKAGTGGPRRAPAAGTYVVEAGDTLWDIAAAHLRPADRSAANVHRYWQEVYRVNRPVIGPDPDLIHPRTRLDVPPYRRDGR